MGKQTKFTKSARGEECTLRIYPYCNGNPETTVLCHAPSDDKGMGIKSPDWWGAYGCSSCHDVIDGRTATGFSVAEKNNLHMDGIYRTQKRMIEKGLIKI